MRIGEKFVKALCLVVSISGCALTSAGSGCIEGRSEACAGDDGVMGAQTCEEGGPFVACLPACLPASAVLTLASRLLTDLFKPPSTGFPPAAFAQVRRVLALLRRDCGRQKRCKNTVLRALFRLAQTRCLFFGNLCRREPIHEHKTRRQHDPARTTQSRLRSTKRRAK